MPAIREMIALARDISNKYGHAAIWELRAAVEALRGTPPMLANGGRLDGPGYPGADYSSEKGGCSAQRPPFSVRERGG